MRFWRENGRLAANGARRTDGQINELSRVVYSTCNLCAKDPSKAPLWQIRALSAVQDLEHKKIEYQDAVMEMYGIPVGYMPYFWHADPSVKRASGLLIPSIGGSSHLGAFFAQPYYWVIDDQSDATFTPMMTTRAGPAARGRIPAPVQQRHLAARRLGRLSRSTRVQGTIYAKGQFNLDDTWRWGFNIARASSADYIRDFHLGGRLGTDPNVLTSQIYGEGFGQGAYSRFDVRFYQSLNDTIVSSKLPLVLPRYEYSYFGQPDSLGGRLSLDAGAFNVMRTDGTNTRRAASRSNWSRPFVGALGDLWKITLHNDAIAYDASAFNEQPNFGPKSQVNAARAQPQAALDFRWPFMRDSGAWGTQLIEPIAQIVVGPQAGDSQNTKYPNEDSLDLEFSDANLFGFNRFPGVDRLDGGVRANVALHGAWYLGGTTFDGLIGQSYRTNVDNLFPEASGLHDQVSDVVARATLGADKLAQPDLSHAARPQDVRHPDGGRAGDRRRAEILGQRRLFLQHLQSLHAVRPAAAAAAGQSPFFTPRNEMTLGVSSNWGKYRFSGWARRNLQLNQMVAVGADAVYEDECYILDLRVYRRYTSYNGDQWRDNGADPDDLQDGRTVRLQSALTLRRPRSWPTQHPHGSHSGCCSRNRSRRSLCRRRRRRRRRRRGSWPW